MEGCSNGDGEKSRFPIELAEMNLSWGGGGALTPLGLQGDMTHSFTHPLTHSHAHTYTPSVGDSGASCWPSSLQMILG